MPFNMDNKDTDAGAITDEEALAAVAEARRLAGEPPQLPPGICIVCGRPHDGHVAKWPAAPETPTDRAAHAMAAAVQEQVDHNRIATVCAIASRLATQPNVPWHGGATEIAEHAWQLYEAVCRGDETARPITTTPERIGLG